MKVIPWNLICYSFSDFFPLILDNRFVYSEIAIPFLYSAGVCCPALLKIS